MSARPPRPALGGAPLTAASAGDLAVRGAPVADAVAARLTIEGALAALPPALRTVFVLKEVEGYSHAEIAGLVGIRQPDLHPERMRTRTWRFAASGE